MKKGICLIERLYVPYGQTVHVESLRVDKLIVDGSLIVEGKISACLLYTSERSIFRISCR